MDKDDDWAKAYTVTAPPVADLQLMLKQKQAEIDQLKWEASRSHPNNILSQPLYNAVRDAVKAAMADAQPGKTDLGDAIEGVLKGLKELTVPHGKVDELGRAVERNKQDRAVGRKTPKA